MGNTELKPQIIHSNQWIMIKQINHTIFGPVKVFRNSQEKLQCLRTFTMQQENEANQIFEKFTQIQLDQSKYNLVRINNIEKEIESQLCSTFHKIHLTLDFSEKFVEHHTQIDIQVFLLDIIKTLQYLDQKNIDTCQLCLSKLLLFGNKVRLVDQQLLTQQSDYQRILSGEIRCEDWYFSPEVMKCLRQNDQQLFNNEKTTVFNLGLILVALFTGITPYKGGIYNYDKCCLTEKFDTYIKQLIEQNLGQQLKQIIFSCLSLVPEKRPTYAVLLEKLSDNLIFDEVISQSPKKTESNYDIPTNQLVSFNPTVMDERVLSNTTNEKLQDNVKLMKKIDEEKHQNTPVCPSPKFRQETLQTHSTIGNLKTTKLYNLDNLQKENKRNQNSKKRGKQLQKDSHKF